MSCAVQWAVGTGTRSLVRHHEIRGPLQATISSPPLSGKFQASTSRRSTVVHGGLSNLWRRKGARCGPVVRWFFLLRAAG